MCVDGCAERSGICIINIHMYICVQRYTLSGTSRMPDGIQFINSLCKQRNIYFVENCKLVYFCIAVTTFL